MRRLLVSGVVVVAIFSIAATPGDVGGCGKTAELLDRDRFGQGRKRQDCEKCQECAITTERCARACDPTKAPDIELPVTCRPLFQDGVVCLHALDSASCDKFATYVDDVAPAVPSECAFCRIGPEEPASSFTDGGAVGAGEGGAP